MITSAACDENPPYNNPQTARENGNEKVQDVVGYWFLCERRLSTLLTVPLRDFCTHGLDFLCERRKGKGQEAAGFAAIE